MNDQKEVAVLHYELNEWKSEIELINIQVETFQKQLNDIALRNTKAEVLRVIGENRFKANKICDFANGLSNAIQDREHYLAEESLVNKQDNALADDHMQLRTNFDEFLNDFKEFKESIHNFLIEWM